MLAIRNWSFRSPISFAPRERRLLRVTINLPQLKRQRGPKCELFTSATEARNQWFIKAETSLEAGRRGGKEANYVSLFCAHSDQFIICRSRGFIHSILRFLPQPTPPSGSRRAGDNSRPGGKLQVAQKCFPAKGRGGKAPTLENKWEGGSPEGTGSGWRTANFGEPEEAARARGPRSPHAAASQQRAGAGGAGRRLRPRGHGEGTRQPPAPRRHRALSSLLPYSPPHPRLGPLPLPLPGAPSSRGFQMSHRRLTPLPPLLHPCKWGLTSRGRAHLWLRITDI